MSNHTYSISEIVGTSTQGVDDAVRNGIAKASQTLRNLDWFEVKEVRGHLEDGKIADWQVTIKIGFRLEDH
ncbi:dodecin [Pseudarthrobacter phenanthrenivorans]|uniref:Dodecin family protein n=1 Tax=Pseudarthrobacter phenanthrenivorans TaxID=361575 RepID=A0A0B4D149_PSEPS|nr:MULTISPECIES: dodecin [Micrococcaceae]KIC67214.1 dodecin family protein [Pseudarthrobacter phenanthrenivorans]MDJ0458538.1 dodecin family protein [Arthrobacter sp. NQ7]